jgi:hypothetical protein
MSNIATLCEIQKQIQKISALFNLKNTGISFRLDVDVLEDAVSRGKFKVVNKFVARSVNYP